MLHQILCYVKFHAASNFMLRQISSDYATKFEEDRKSETCSVQFKQQIKTQILAGITLHTLVFKVVLFGLTLFL